MQRQLCINDAEKKSVNDGGFNSPVIFCYNHSMEKNVKGYLKTYQNIYECPNCGKEASVRYGVMKCEHCGKEYLVKRKFISLVVIIVLFLGISELFWNGNFFEGDAMMNSLVLVGLIILSNAVVGYLIYRFVPGGAMEFEEITEENREK